MKRAFSEIGPFTFGRKERHELITGRAVSENLSFDDLKQMYKDSITFTSEEGACFEHDADFVVFRAGDECVGVSVRDRRSAAEILWLTLGGSVTVVEEDAEDDSYERFHLIIERLEVKAGIINLSGYECYNCEPTREEMAEDEMLREKSFKTRMYAPHEEFISFTAGENCRLEPGPPFIADFFEAFFRVEKFIGPFVVDDRGVKRILSSSDAAEWSRWHDVCFGHNLRRTIT